MVTPANARRINKDNSGSIIKIFLALTSGHTGAVTVLAHWKRIDPQALLHIETILDGKGLYDEHIWDVYLLCDRDINRFIYHVSMELPDQRTGKVTISGKYQRQVDIKEFLAKRTFGRPGSYWGLKNPPREPHYSYPIT